MGNTKLFNALWDLSLMADVDDVSTTVQPGDTSPSWRPFTGRSPKRQALHVMRAAVDRAIAAGGVNTKNHKKARRELRRRFAEATP